MIEEKEIKIDADINCWQLGIHSICNKHNTNDVSLIVDLQNYLERVVLQDREFRKEALKREQEKLNGLFDGLEVLRIRCAECPKIEMCNCKKKCEGYIFKSGVGHRVGERVAELRKEIFEDFLKYWDELTEKQDIVTSVDMKKSKRLIVQVIPKYIKKFGSEKPMTDATHIKGYTQGRKDNG